jgi:tetratricopeptide (TPR) repeat protein
MSLSLCMIVKDEAANLPRCLASVQGVVDEMVIVDTGSTDDTITIAKDAGAKVYKLPWPNDFAAARNHALQYVQADWILVLDADEALRPEIVPALQQAIQNPQQLVINLLRQEIGSNQAPYSLLSRLFRHHPAIQFERPFHELIDASVEKLLETEPQWQVSYLPDIAIDHYGYDTATIHQKSKLERAQTMMQTYLKQHPQDAYVCSKLGGLYVKVGEIAKAILLLQRGLQTVSDSHNQYELHYHLGLAYSANQQLELAEQQYQTALEQPIPEALKIGARTNLGNLLQEWGVLDASYRQFLQVVQIAPNLAMGHFNLGLSLRALGEVGAAIQSYQRALRLQPDYPEAYQNLGAAFLAQGQVQPGLAAFRQAITGFERSQPQAAQSLRLRLSEMGYTI